MVAFKCCLSSYIGVLYHHDIFAVICIWCAGNFNIFVNYAACSLKKNPEGISAESKALFKSQK